MSIDLGDELKRLEASLAGHSGAGVALRSLVEGLPIAALVADDHGRLVAANAAASDLTGYSKGELLRRSVQDITAGEDESSFAPLWRGFVASGRQRGTYRLVTKAGATVHVEYAALRIGPDVNLSLLHPARRPVTGDPDDGRSR